MWQFSFYILKQKGKQHNKQCGKFSCIIRMYWRKTGNTAKMALQISTDYSYNGDRIGQGRENVKELLRQNKDLAKEIEQKVREKLIG